MIVLLILRIVIGWHFLYEGISKIPIPDWTSAGYLESSRWFFSDFFHWIVSNPTVLAVVDWLNIAGLCLIGLALKFGLFTRLASITGILLLALYYVANPPFNGTDFGIPAEGHYLYINKNLVEMVSLLVIAVFPVTSLPALEKLIQRPLRKKMDRSGKQKESDIATHPVWTD